MPDLEVPLVSIVIPTHNRRARLLSTLEALRRQTFAVSRMECVIVADGCRDDTVAAVAAFASEFPIRLVELPGQGPACARNAGVSVAQAPLLLFLDDDVEPEPELVAAHVAAHEASVPRAVVGAYPPFPHASPDPFRLEARSWWLTHFDELAREGHRATFRDLLTGNLSMPAQLWHDVGGLDPEFEHAREDWELGVRLISHGAPITFLSDARGWHYEHETSRFETGYVRAREEGRSDVRMARKHPGMRGELPIVQMYPAQGPTKRLAWMAFDAPWLGSLYGKTGFRLLQLCRRHRLRGPFRALHGAVRQYWYLVGAASELQSQRNWADLATRDDSGPPADLTVDLAQGIERAEQQIAAARPSQVKIEYSGRAVATMPWLPAAEPWDARHLRPFLAREACTEYSRVLRITDAADGEEKYNIAAYGYISARGFHMSLLEAMGQWWQVQQR